MELIPADSLVGEGLLTPRVSKVELFDDRASIWIARSEEGFDDFVAELDRIESELVTHVFERQPEDANKKCIEVVHDRFFSNVRKFNEGIVVRTKVKLGENQGFLLRGGRMRLTFSKMWVIRGGCKFGINAFLQFCEEDALDEKVEVDEDDGDDDDSYRCPITLEPTRTPVTTQCGHTFELHALETYRLKLCAEYMAHTCPMCRREMANADETVYGLCVNDKFRHRSVWTYI